MIRYKVCELIWAMLRTELVETDLCSPNYVADFAYTRGYTLKSNEVVYISNNYVLGASL